MFCGDLDKHNHWKTDYPEAPNFVLAVVNCFPYLTKEFNKAIESYEQDKAFGNHFSETELNQENADENPNTMYPNYDEFGEDFQL